MATAGTKELARGTNELDAQIVVDSGSNMGPTGDDYRLLASRQNRILLLRLASAEPALAVIVKRFFVEVSKDCGRDDDVMVREHGGPLAFGGRVDELLPKPSTSLQLRLTMFAERVLAETLNLLRQTAASALKLRGY